MLCHVEKIPLAKSPPIWLADRTWQTADGASELWGRGFFDVERRLEVISAKGDPLETIKKVVPWEDFRADIEAVTETKPE